MFRFFEELGFLDRLRGQMWVKPAFTFGDQCYGYLDQGWLEIIGPGGFKALSLFYLKGSRGETQAWFRVRFLCYISTALVLG